MENYNGNMKRQWLSAKFYAVIITLLCLPFSGYQPDVIAAQVIFNDFSDTSLLTLNGNSRTVTTGDGVVLRLTEAQLWQAGSVFSTQPLRANNFSTYFTFRITDPGGRVSDCNTESGADGIVFVIQSVSSSIGASGGDIGYGGISPSVGIEFDTWCNAAYNDPGSNHVGIDVNGYLDHGTGAPFTKTITPNFDNGEVWNVWVDYNGTVLEVRLSTTATRPAEPTLKRNIDIANILGQNTAYVGFTSGTGEDWGNHDIITWEYRDFYEPIQGTTQENESCDESALEAAREQGRQECINDPASCGIQVSGDYQNGYEAGLAACMTSECATFDIIGNVLHIPCLDIGAPSTYWLDLHLVKDRPILLQLTDFGQN